MAQRWGATAAEWAHWDLVLGLTDDLLPVVSNPGAKISERSTLKTLGKSPSTYNAQHRVIGTMKWPERVTDGLDIEDWAKVPDYGLFLQTRRVRALDIDVPDRTKSAAISAFVADFTGLLLPRRWRADSGKQLLAFELDGDWTKRIVPVDGGIVEVLMHGNGFVAGGAHQDGERYQWDGGLPGGFPALSGETFEALYAGLVARFAVGKPTEVRRVARGADLGVDDEIAAWLVENWETFGADRDGRRLFVRCPWVGDHTVDSGETEAAWLMRGTGGVEQGHFKCLHAHCGSRGREEFLREVGWVQSGFDVIESAPAAKSKELNGHVVELSIPNFDRKKGAVNRNGIQIIRAVLDNLVMACERPDICGVRLAYDSFSEEKLIAAEEDAEWRPFKDVDEVRIRKHLERCGFEAPIPHRLMKDAILDVSDANAFDSARKWLEGRPAWDGVERCERFMTTYMGTADTPYAAAIGLYAWTAHAGRVMVPGIKADMVIALTGPQGQRKSGAIAAIAPKPEYATELNLHKDEVELARQMRGVLIAEIPELRGLNSRGADVIRAWITARQEKWAHKFEEHATIFRRRLVFWSTANDLEFLADSTGERRWLPIEVERMCDEEGVIRDRDQLWAEGLWRFRESGVAWAEAERLARAEHSHFKVSDEWEELVRGWLLEVDLSGARPHREGGFTGMDVARGALGLDPARYGKSDQMRISRVLRELGYEQAKKRTEDGVIRHWIRSRIV